MVLPSPASPSDPPVLTPAPVTIIEPAAEVRSPSPASPDARERKTQSTFNPVTTAGLWDSGVVDGPRLKSRPTSLVVVNSKKEKAKRKQERSTKGNNENGKGKVKEKEKEKERGGDGPVDKSGGGGLRRFFSVFRREKKK
jgi:hypothetical protein